MKLKKHWLALGFAAALAAPLAQATPLSIDFSYLGVVGHASLDATLQAPGVYWATSGTLEFTSGPAELLGPWTLSPAGPGITGVPGFNVDNLIFPSDDPHLDVYGIVGFSNGTDYINLWGNSPGNYSLWEYQSSGYTYTYDGPMDVSVTVPDSGTTIYLLGAGITILGAVRRKLGKA